MSREDLNEDVRLLRHMARWLEKHDSTIFDPESDDQENAAKLLTDMADWVEAMGEIAAFFGVLPGVVDYRETRKK